MTVVHEGASWPAGWVATRMTREDGTRCIMLGHPAHGCSLLYSYKAEDRVTFEFLEALLGLAARAHVEAGAPGAGEPPAEVALAQRECELKAELAKYDVAKGRGESL